MQMPEVRAAVSCRARKRRERQTATSQNYSMPWKTTALVTRQTAAKAVGKLIGLGSQGFHPDDPLRKTGRHCGKTSGEMATL